MHMQPDAKSSIDTQMSSTDSALTRRELIQAAAWAAGGSLLAGSVLDPHALMASALNNPASYITKDRIAATPTFRYRPYRSHFVPTPAGATWVQIDLGTPQAIDSIKLFPANQRMIAGMDAYYGGEGFPESFKIEVSADADFTRAATIIDFTGAPFTNPKDAIVSFSAHKQKARYVRLTATKLTAPQCTALDPGAPEGHTVCSAEGKYQFALARIAVIADGKDVSVGRPVTVDPAHGNPDDAAQITRPERIESEYVHRDRPSHVTDPATWKPVAYNAHAPVHGVTLEGGVFEATMRNNITYLMESYTLDDLLLQFRTRAGKPIPLSDRKPNQFWETDLAGSNAGRFLMGAGNTLRWIDDPTLRQRLDALVAGIADCRDPNGNVMAFNDDTIFFSERGAYTRAWLTHGLIEAGYAGHPETFQMLRANYDRFNQGAYLPELHRGAVQGGQGMIANTRMYFTPLGKPADIQLIQRYYIEDKWLAALARYDKDQIWQYPYDRPHCYLLTNLEAYMDVYRATGDQRIHDGVKAAWEMYNAHWEQPGASISIIEYMYCPPDSESLTQLLGEFCGSAFWVFLSQRFQLIHPEEERYAAEIESALYNVAMASQQGTTGLRYHAILEGKKEKGTRGNTCCEGQGTRLIGSMPEHIYSIASDGVYVHLFEPSTVRFDHQGQPVTVRMETKFPHNCAVKLTVTGAQAMKLRVRVPRWATGEMAIAVNGQAAGSGKPGSYLTLDRTWADGDQVTFTLPAGFTVVEYKGANQVAGHKRYSLTWGPLLYAAVGSKDAALSLPAGSGPQDLGSHLTPKPDAPLHFTVAANPAVTYMPYWQVDDEEFTCFPVVDTA